MLIRKTARDFDAFSYKFDIVRESVSKRGNYLFVIRKVPFGMATWAGSVRYNNCN